MAKLVYATITSLDGYTTNKDGNFDWAMPGLEVITCANDIERRCRTSLYGRRMYETMVYWETNGDADDDSPEERDFAGMWRSATKIVYSTTMVDVSSANTRIERTFDADAVRRLKLVTDHDISISGPNLAGQAIEAGLVDEMHLFVIPVTVGGGTSAYPDGVHSNLELLGFEPFGDGTVHLHYRFDS